MRAALALLSKEVSQHAPSLLGAALLCTAALLASGSLELERQTVTLLSAAHRVVQYGLPMLALFVAERLVARDYQAGTHEFLAALPVSGGLRALVRWGLGLSVVLSAAVMCLLTTAWLASRREGVPLTYLAALGVQHAGYLFAWFGLAFGIAHLGHFRWLIWWLLLAGGMVSYALVDAPLERVFWFGLMLDGAEKGRLAPPWVWLPRALAWGAAGTALGFAASAWRGGWLLERAFRPVTARQRAGLFAIGLAGLAAIGVSEKQAPRDDPWGALPAVDAERAVIRVAASPGAPLWEVGAEAASALDGLGAALDIDTWPPIVLLRGSDELGAPAVTVGPGGEADVSRVLRVDLEKPQHEVVRQVVSEALAHRLAGLASWDAEAWWVVQGLAPWWMLTERPEPSELERLSRRAAAGKGLALRASSDWYSVWRELGPDHSVAMAWAGFVALEEEGGREAVLAVARAVLGPDRRPTWPSGARLRFTTRSDFVGRWTGVDRQTHVAAWEEVLARPVREGVPELPVLPALTIDTSAGEVVVSWREPLPPDTVLEWTDLAPLREAPLPSDKLERIAPAEGLRELSLPADIRRRVAVRWVYAHALGLYTSPWKVAP